MSQDHSLFAVNEGSSEVSVFAVEGARLSLVDKVTSGRTQPNAVAQPGSLVHVLNVVGSNLAGFRGNDGTFHPTHLVLRRVAPAKMM